MMNRVQRQDEAACVEMSLIFTFWVCYNAGGGIIYSKTRCISTLSEN
jgi:hypothetical protein